MLASKYGHLDLVRLLLRSGASAAARASSGVTALSLAARNGSSEIVSLLLAATPPPLRMDIESALKDAVSGSGRDLSDPVVIAFMKAGIVSINFVWRVAGQADGEAETAVDLWLKRGVDVNMWMTPYAGEGRKPWHRLTLLMLACILGAPELVKLLLQRGAAVSLQNSEDSGALALAVRNYDKFEEAEVIRLILAASPSDDDIFDAGWQATRAGASPSGVEALIEGGLNVNAVLTTSRRGRDGDDVDS